MIAHVAAAGERSGRVVLWLGGSAGASRFAIEAAMSIAQSFQAAVDSLYVEDKQLFDLAEFPFARAIAHTAFTGAICPVRLMTCEMRISFVRGVIPASNASTIAFGSAGAMGTLISFRESFSRCSRWRSVVSMRG